jgi:RNA ligase (TIGR02306 family)
MKLIKIKSIKKIDLGSLRYDIETKKTHNFFANNILVHNSSITIYQINGKFGVCSRNIDLKRDISDKYWKAVSALDLENKFKTYFPNQNIALQGELIGEGIQGNKYKLNGHRILFFNVYFIQKYTYGNFEELNSLCVDLQLTTVPFLGHIFLTDNISQLVEMSKGSSRLNEQTLREGIVIRPCEEIQDNELHCQLVKNRVSFKSVNPEYLLKYDC